MGKINGQAAEIRGQENPEAIDSKVKFLNETIEFWQKQTARPLTNEDARQIAENVAGVFTLLAEWNAKQKFGGAIPVDDSSNCRVTGDGV